MSNQIKRLPKGPIWTGNDLTIAFIVGVIVGFIIAWV